MPFIAYSQMETPQSFKTKYLVQDPPAEVASKLNLPRSSGTACSSAALLRISPALIRNNATLIRTRAEITAEEMLLNQKGKQPEGVLKLPGLQRTLRLVEGMASSL